MRHERSATASGIDQMFFEGERNWYRIKDAETGKLLDEDFEMNRTGYVEVVGGAYVTRPGWSQEKSKAFPIEKVIVEGDIRTNNSR